MDIDVTQKSYPRFINGFFCLRFKPVLRIKQYLTVFGLNQYFNRIAESSPPFINGDLGAPFMPSLA